MCGRMTVTTEMKILQKRFQATYAGMFKTPRYNVAPGTNILAVLNTHPGEIRDTFWGFAPSWARQPLVNIRAETLRDKPTFKRNLHNNRCLILADGFYEWKQEGDKKTPYFISLQNREPFAMAGIWREGEEGRPECAIITTTPNSLMEPIHNRMPAILPREKEAEWLQNEAPPVELLFPYHPEGMRAHPVSRQVNRAEAEGAALIEAILP